MNSSNIQNLKATILEVQRMSTEDGPGIRTTVFFKGCSLHCAWCHNPESISSHPQVHWIGNRCIGCRTCLEVCPENALSFSETGNIVDRNLCAGCGVCAEECPGAALELLGKRWNLKDLIAEVIKDRVYFEKSHGGITLGGGEPALQSRFNAAFLKGLKEMHIHTAVDTCGQCSRKSLADLLPYTDLLLYDIKEIHPEKHQKYTGSGNEKIFDNLIYVRDCMTSKGYPGELWIRTPIIPGATDAEANIRGIGHFIGSNLNGFVSRWDLCAFNNLCKDKYLRLDLDWDYKDCELLSISFMQKIASIAKTSSLKPEIVHWSGSTKLEEM